MDQPNLMSADEDDDGLSPYRTFLRDEWAKLRADAPMTLAADEVVQLQSLNDPISLDEVAAIYLPLSRLLSLYVAATQGLFKATQRFLLAEHQEKVPYIIGVAGSVAVGKSTTARVLKALLARWPNTPKVDLVTTDGFLLPNAELTRLGSMERKGFPESYDTGKLLHFLADIKAGKRNVKAPLYSHLVYDVVPGEETVVDRPDILIVEGLNVLQPARMPKDGTAIPFVSDFFDYFRRYAELPEAEAIATADGLWNRINLPNLRDNIVPTRQRASLILKKGPSHRIETVALRRL